MNVHVTETDNTDIKPKIDLRIEATACLSKLRVLDLFAGENRVWSHFKCEKYYGIEKKRGKGKNLWADNCRVIPSLDLSKFNVIDMDAYGMPFDQMDLVFENRTLQDGTVIVFTCITGKTNQISARMVRKYGLESVYSKAKLLTSVHAKERFFDLLRRNGIEQVSGYSDDGTYKKFYGYFTVGQEQNKIGQE